MSKHSPCFVFAGYFVFLVLLALGLSWHQGNFDWTTPLAQFNARLDVGDPTSFAMGARDVARTGWITQPNVWLVHLWPPGFMVLEGVLMRLVGEDGPVLLALLVASALLCALWMTLLRGWLLGSTRPALATLAPLIPFAFPLTPFFLLAPIGLAFGECFAISLFLAGFLFSLLAFRTGSVRQAVLSGLCVAGAAYCRSQFELVVVFLTLIGGLIAGVAGIAWLARRRIPFDPWVLGMVAVVLVTAHATMAPWRYHNLVDTGDARWVTTSDLVFANAMLPEDVLVKRGGAFVVEGGGALACKLEPAVCGRDDAASFYGAFVRHMDRWIVEKWSRFPSYWVAPPRAGALGPLGATPGPFEIATNLVFLGLVLAGLAQLWRMRHEPVFAVQCWLQLSLYGCLAAVYTLVHFEARYMYLPKIFAVVSVLTLPGPRDPEPGRAGAWRSGLRALSAAFGKVTPAAAFALYFLAVMLVARIGSSPDAGSDWMVPLREFARSASLGEAVQFANAAADVARIGAPSAQNAWIAGAWPPGALFTQGWLMRFIGQDGPVLFALLVLAALACASWMTLLRRWLLDGVPPAAATLAPLMPFAFPLTPFFLLSPVGLSLGTGFGVSFFLSGFLLALIAFRASSLRDAALAGVAFAAAAYFSAQLQSVVLFLSVAGAVACAVALLRRRARPAAWQTLRVVAVTVLVGQACMLPWRIHNLHTFGDTRWVRSSVVANALRPESELVAAGARYVVAGGGALACKLEPSFCGQSGASYFYRAFFRSPAAWIGEKLRLVPGYWMAPPHHAYLIEAGPGSPLEDKLNAVLVACLAAGLLLLWRVARRPMFLPHAWLQLSVYCSLAASLVFVPLEARDLYLPKIFALVALMALWGPRTLRDTGGGRATARDAPASQSERR